MTTETLLNTFKYKLIVGNRTICYGITTDLHRRELEHKRRWPDAHVEQIDEPTSHREAWEWRKSVSTSSPQTL